MNELQKALMPAMVNMTDTLAERVYETLNHFLQEYYNSYSPVYYRRLYDFLRSAAKVEPKIKGNKVVASVFIDTDYMDDYYNSDKSDTLLKYFISHNLLNKKVQSLNN